MSSTPSRPSVNGFHPRLPAPNGANGTARRGVSLNRDATSHTGLGAASAVEEEEREEDPVHVMLRQRWAQAEANIVALFVRTCKRLADVD